MQVFVRYRVKFPPINKAAYQVTTLLSCMSCHTWMVSATTTAFLVYLLLFLRAFSEFSLQFDVYFPILVSNIRTLNEISIQYLYVQ